MGLEKIIPAIFLIIILILIIPEFIVSNSKLRQFIRNLSIWSIIVVAIMLVSYLIF